MSLYFFEGPAGSGKTTQLFQKLEQVLADCPLAESQRVLALTKMHGSRRAMDTRLQAVPGLRKRYRCCTADSFAWNLVQRWRTLARAMYSLELSEEDYEQVCNLAGNLLANLTVAQWVSRTYPIIIVDEFQDCKGGQLKMVSYLSRSAICILAADGFQDLEDSGVNPAVEWAHANAETKTLNTIYRSRAAGILNASRALRQGGNIPCKGHGFTLLGAQNHNVGASFVSKQLTWWNGCDDIAVLTPVRPTNSPFVYELAARVAAKPISSPPVGPHRIPWEDAQDEECDKFIKELEMPDNPNARISGVEFSFNEISGPGQGLRAWIERQNRVAGRTEFTVEEITRAARRIFHWTRASRPVRDSGVRGMTIHQAKNREFHSVIVLWPYQVSGDRLVQCEVQHCLKRAFLGV